MDWGFAVCVESVAYLEGGDRKKVYEFEKDGVTWRCSKCRAADAIKSTRFVGFLLSAVHLNRSRPVMGAGGLL